MNGIGFRFGRFNSGRSVAANGRSIDVPAERKSHYHRQPQHVADCESEHWGIQFCRKSSVLLIAASIFSIANFALLTSVESVLRSAIRCNGSIAFAAGAPISANA